MSPWLDFPSIDVIWPFSTVLDCNESRQLRKALEVELRRGSGCRILLDGI